MILVDPGRTPLRMFWLCSAVLVVSVQVLRVAGATVPSRWRLYRYWCLKLLTVGAPLTASGRLFQVTITLELKKFLLYSC